MTPPVSPRRWTSTRRVSSRTSPTSWESSRPGSTVILSGSRSSSKAGQQRPEAGAGTSHAPTLDRQLGSAAVGPPLGMALPTHGSSVPDGPERGPPSQGRRDGGTPSRPPGEGGEEERKTLSHDMLV